MRDSVPSASYSSVCNVLRQWSILLIPTYRVYRLYDNTTTTYLSPLFLLLSLPPPSPPPLPLVDTHYDADRERKKTRKEKEKKIEKFVEGAKMRKKKESECGGGQE